MARKTRKKVFSPEKYSGIISGKSTPLSGGQMPTVDMPIYEHLNPPVAKKGKKRKES